MYANLSRRAQHGVNDYTDLTRCFSLEYNAHLLEMRKLDWPSPHMPVPM
jgi:hypothetical protein